LTQWALVYPVVVQVALTFGLLMWTGAARVGAIRRGEVKVEDIALGQDAWPPRVRQISNSYHNQFQLPLLFYLACGLALLSGKVSSLLVLLAWGFVAARIVHAVIHTTSNVVRQRFVAFLVGTSLLVVIWVVVTLAIILDPS